VTNRDALDPVHAALRTWARSRAPTPDCLDDETTAALADGTIAPPMRKTALTHLAGCAHCRGAVASVARAIANPAVAREVAAVEGGGRRRLSLAVLSLAAAAGLVLVLTVPRPLDDGSPVHRAPPGATAGTPAPVSPVGIVAEAAVLRWTGVTGADRYRVTLSDAGGRVLYETQVTDTAAALPDSITLVPGRSYMWLVEARIGFDRWSTSRLVEFSIAGPPSP